MKGDDAAPAPFECSNHELSVQEEYRLTCGVAFACLNAK
jgi:hypothetical protein